MDAAVVEQRVRGLLSRGEDAAAATEVLHVLGPQIRRYLRALLGDEAEVSDAYSMFAESLWKALPAFRGDASLRTWCFQLAWSSARALRRDAWWRRARRLRTGEASRLAEQARTGSSLREDQRRLALETLRRELDLREQSLLELRIDQELSWAEIAGVMASPSEPLTEAAVMKRFERLKRRLGRLARERGLLD